MPIGGTRLSRRRLLTSAAALSGAAALPLSACSTQDPPPINEPWSIPDQDPTATVKVLSILDLQDDQMQAVIDAFEKEHPTITIEWQTVPFDSLNSTIDARVANRGGDPDLYWADQPRISALAARGEMADLTDVFGRYEDTFDPTSYASGVYHDRLWALPIANSTQLLYYNRSLLQKAKLDAPSAAVEERISWRRLAEDALAAKRGGAKYGFAFGQFDRYYQLECLPVQLGGSVGARGPENLTPDFSSPQWVQAMTWYGSLFADGAAPRGMTPDETDPAFVAGQIAYMVEGPWLLPRLHESDLDWGVAPQPVFDGGKPATATGSWSVAMNPFSKNKAAAGIFMKWLAIEDGGGYIRYRSSPEMPASVKAEDVYFGKDVFDSEAGRQATKIIKHERAETAVARVRTVGYIEFETILNQAFSDIRNGAEPKAALTDAESQLTTAWKKYL